MAENLDHAHAVGGTVREHEPLIENRKFGLYLRRVREDRRLSLDAVEEMTVGFPGRVTKSHLSRIENGQAVPTFPRMFALSQIYGVPISSLAERFEMDLRADLSTADLAGRDLASLRAETYQLKVSGRYPEALRICELLIERHALESGSEENERLSADLRLERIECLYRLGRYGLAKEECEELLNWSLLSAGQRVTALHHFVVCSFRLQRFEIALMGMEQAERALDAEDVPVRLRADLAATRGNISQSMGRPTEAVEAYRRALALYEEQSIPFEVCRTRINITSSMIELGQVEHAKKMLKKALEEAEGAGYDRQAALALSNLALIAFKSGDAPAAESWCIRSNSIARPREFHNVVFRNCYYLWKISRQQKDHAAVRAHERALKSYLGRIEEPFQESESFRAYLAGGKP